MADDSGKSLVFISYSHKDEIWKDRLRPHLDMFSFDSELVIWDDRQIEPTTAWFEEIQDIMERAKVAICLISPDYLSSSFCRNHEIPYLLQRHAKGEMILIFILVRPCAWDKLPWLAALQILPRDNKAISKHFKDDWDTPFADIARHVVGRLEGQAMLRNILAEEEKSDSRPPIPIDLTRLPTSGMDVVGRDKELQFLNDAFDGDTLNVVSLRAWGGVGKSTLVNKWCEYLAADNFRGARRVFAWSFYSQGTNERVTSADAFIDEALRFFGDDDPTAGSPWAKGERLAELVGKEKALLILDGMEPLLDEHQGIKDPALARLVECLAEANAGLCVITTREPVKEFSDFPETTKEVDLEQLSKEAGRALLRIKGLRASDKLLEQASEAFGNHALALNLLASYLKRFAGGDVNQALTIPDLPDVSVEGGKHPRRVMTAFAEVFCDGPELDLLFMMSLFDRPADGGCIAALKKPPAIPGLTDKIVGFGDDRWKVFVLEIAEFGLLATPKTNPDDEKKIQQLRKIGLFVPDKLNEKQELDAHPIVREHFEAWLRAEREEAWQAGHKRLYEHLKTVPEKHQPDTLAEMAPLFQAVHHGCQADRQEEALYDLYAVRINRRPDDFYLTKKLGATTTNLGLLGCFFASPFKEPALNLGKAERKWLLQWTGSVLTMTGRLREGLSLTQEDWESCIEREDWLGATFCGFNLSELLVVLGETTKATEIAEKTVEYADLSGELFGRSASRALLGFLRHQVGLLEAATKLFREAETIQLNFASDHPYLYSFQGYCYCDLMVTLGQTKSVRARALQIIEWVKSEGLLLATALGHLSLGQAALALRQQDEAGLHLEQAVNGLREAGVIHHVPRGLLVRAAFFRKMEDHERSGRDLAETMRLAKRCGMRLFECDAHLEYARLALAESNPDAALPHLERADALVTDCGYHRRDPEIAELKEKLEL